ncbi:MAG: S8 family serine peptidase [Chloroflexi bacterium]|nr:S8 family serine peptidase [Chloroflexota bacterium]
MNKRLWVMGCIGAALIIVSIRLARIALAERVCGADYAPGRVLVSWRDTVLPAQRSDGGHLLVDRPAINLWSVPVPIGQECAAVARLQRDTRVAYADLDYAIQTTDVITPTDPGWAQQWALPQINAPQAWRIVTDTTPFVIAVIDSGLKLDHPDLVSQLWTNSGETPGNFIDDDGNGQIDDVQGWHFYHAWAGATYVPRQDANITDDYGHGTHVAGIIGAAANNGVGIVGVTWAARLMPVKVLNQYGNGWYSDIAAGIVYAVDNGARIINLSLGGETDSPVLQEPIEYAQAHDVLVIAATGNSGGSVLYPAAYPAVLAVAAIDQFDQHAAFSNFGPEVDVAAPGVDIYSTWPWVTGYFTKSGTSMAAPHIAGAAALVWANWPELTAGRVAGYITQTATDAGSAGPDLFTGWGRVDVYGAVLRATPWRLRLPLIFR